MAADRRRSEGEKRPRRAATAALQHLRAVKRARTIAPSTRRSRPASAFRLLHSPSLSSSSSSICCAPDSGSEQSKREQRWRALARAHVAAAAAAAAAARVQNACAPSSLSALDFFVGKHRRCRLSSSATTTRQRTCRKKSPHRCFSAIKRVSRISNEQNRLVSICIISLLFMTANARLLTNNF